MLRQKATTALKHLTSARDQVHRDMERLFQPFDGESHGIGNYSVPISPSAVMTADKAAPRWPVVGGLMTVMLAGVALLYLTPRPAAVGQRVSTSNEQLAAQPPSPPPRQGRSIPAPAAAPPSVAVRDHALKEDTTRAIARIAEDRAETAQDKPASVALATQQPSPHLTGAALEDALQKDAQVTRRLNLAALRRIDASTASVAGRSE